MDGWEGACSLVNYKCYLKHSLRQTSLGTLHFIYEVRSLGLQIAREPRVSITHYLNIFHVKLELDR